MPTKVRTTPVKGNAILVSGPLGKDGYFGPRFNKMAGAMNPDVAQYG